MESFDTHRSHFVPAPLFHTTLDTHSGAGSDPGRKVMKVTSRGSSGVLLAAVKQTMQCPPAVGNDPHPHPVVQGLEARSPCSRLPKYKPLHASEVQSWEEHWPGGSAGEDAEIRHRYQDRSGALGHGRNRPEVCCCGGQGQGKSHHYHEWAPAEVTPKPPTKPRCKWAPYRERLLMFVSMRPIGTPNRWCGVAKFIGIKDRSDYEVSRYYADMICREKKKMARAGERMKETYFSAAAESEEEETYTPLDEAEVLDTISEEMHAVYASEEKMISIMQLADWLDLLREHGTISLSATTRTEFLKFAVKNTDSARWESVYTAAYTYAHREKGLYCIFKMMERVQTRLEIMRAVMCSDRGVDVYFTLAQFSSWIQKPEEDVHHTLRLLLCSKGDKLSNLAEPPASFVPGQPMMADGLVSLELAKEYLCCVPEKHKGQAEEVLTWIEDAEAKRQQQVVDWVKEELEEWSDGDCWREREREVSEADDVMQRNGMGIVEDGGTPPSDQLFGDDEVPHQESEDADAYGYHGKEHKNQAGGKRRQAERHMGEENALKRRRTPERDRSDPHRSDIEG